nr:CRISPR-associated protein Cas4 [uncultured Anaerotignum sp.]
MMAFAWNIRSIQHYLYCPHRWGLLEIDRAWAENVFVTKANLLHQRVHDPERSYATKGKRVYTSVSVYYDAEEDSLFGVVDCLEQQQGQLAIVDYKPTMPKDCTFRYDDLMQVFAQKLCVDAVFHCDCDAYLYYADKKKRVALPLRENAAEYQADLKALLAEMRAYLERGVIPPKKKGQKCSGCSMKDLCMPAVKKGKSIRSMIKELDEA